MSICPQGACSYNQANTPSEPCSQPGTWSTHVSSSSSTRCTAPKSRSTDGSPVPSNDPWNSTPSIAHHSTGVRLQCCGAVAYLERNGVRIFYDVVGEGPPVLLSHGYSA